MPPALPPGYVRLAAPHGVIAAPAEFAEWLRQALATHGTLHGYAGAHALRRLEGGRGIVPVIETPFGPWAVRHYHRGGAVARLLGDRYLPAGAPRPLRELAVSAALRTLGVATPPVTAAAVYPAGAWYRGDIATAFIPDAADLAALTLSAGRWPAPERVEAWRAAGTLLRSFFATGAVHADLNLMNILVPRGGGAAQLLDLDRCTPPGRTGGSAAARMLARLHRSRRKLEQRAGRLVDDAELHALETELAR